MNWKLILQRFVLMFILSSFVLQGVSARSAPQSRTDTAAFAQISAERNSETKKKLALDFEKNFPKSKYLAEVYIHLSRILVSQSDFSTAKQYADKAVTAVRAMQSTPPKGADGAWHAWINSLQTSAQSNLAWVNQMLTWQQQQVRSSVVGRRN
jgi:hypothetical protein